MLPFLFLFFLFAFLIVNAGSGHRTTDKVEGAAFSPPPNKQHNKVVKPSENEHVGELFSQTPLNQGQ